MLKRQGVIDTWHDRRIGAGQEIDAAIDNHINSDEIILLLVSPDFIASDYCYNIEMARAMERHAAKEAIVIPVILRACDWHHAPFGKLLATPEDGKPVTLWPDRDVAFLQVAQAVRKAAERCRKDVPIPAPQIARSAPTIPLPLSPLPATAPGRVTLESPRASPSGTKISSCWTPSNTSLATSRTHYKSFKLVILAMKVCIVESTPIAFLRSSTRTDGTLLGDGVYGRSAGCRDLLQPRRFVSGQQLQRVTFGKR